MRFARCFIVVAVVMLSAVIGAQVVWAAEVELDQSQLAEQDDTEGVCTATADCWDGSTVYCSGTSPCSYVDSNCPSTRGYVRCGTTTKYCPVCCVSEGYECSADFMCQDDPGCEDCVCAEVYKKDEPTEVPWGVCVCP